MNFRNYFYNQNAKNKEIIINNESFVHIVKSRRKKQGDVIILKNLKDNFDYFYKITEIKKRNAKIILIKKKEIKKNENENNFHLGFCVIDMKNIKEVLPYINQTGLEKLTFIYSDYSQKNLKINIEKINKILINSSEQCGRDFLMKIEIKNSIKEFLAENKESYILNFGGKNINDIDKDKIKCCIVGPEGGFSEEEIKLFNEEKILSFNTKNILRAENANLSLCSKILI